MPFKNTLSANERLKSRKLFDQLFESGASIFQSPIRLVYIPMPFNAENPVLFGVSVPKRKMRHAHERNRMKRLVREVYRVNKHELIDTCLKQQKSIAILFIVQVNKPLEFDESKQKIILLLQRLTRKHAKATE